MATISNFYKEEVGEKHSNVIFTAVVHKMLVDVPWHVCKKTNKCSMK
jgi:hypothetical protein